MANIVQKALAVLGRKALTVNTVRNGLTVPAYSSSDSSVEPSYALTQARAYTHSLVYTVLEWISTNATSVPWVLERKKGNGNLLDHHRDFLNLLEYPSDFPTPYDELSGQELLDMSIWAVFLCGGAYWYKVRSELGRVIGLEYLRPDAVTTQRNRERAIAAYVYSPPGGARRTIPYGNIVHLRLGRHPFDPMRGRTPLDALGRELWSDDEAARWTASLLRNKAMPGGLLAPPDGEDSLTLDELVDMKAYVQKEFAGNNRGTVGIVGAPLEWHQMSFNPDEMDLSGIRAMCEARVAATFQVPAAVVQFLAGLESTKVGATLKEYERQGWNARLIPLQNSIARQIMAQLFPEFEPEPRLYRLYYDLTAIEALQEDENRRADRLRADLTAGAIMVATFKEERGYEVLPGDDVYLRPFSVMAVPVNAPPSAPAPATRSLASASRLKAILGFETKAVLDEQQAGVIEALKRDADRLADVFEGVIEPVFEQLGQLAADAFLELEPAEAALSNGNGHKNGGGALASLGILQKQGEAEDGDDFETPRKPLISPGRHLLGG